MSQEQVVLNCNEQSYNVNEINTHTTSMKIFLLCNKCNNNINNENFHSTLYSGCSFLVCENFEGRFDDSFPTCTSLLLFFFVLSRDQLMHTSYTF